MDAAREKRGSTSRLLLAQVSVWAMQNAAKLNGKRLAEIAAMVRKQFNGEFITDGAIRDTCIAVGVQLKHGNIGSKKNDRTGAVAKTLLSVVDKIESAIGAQPGTVISADDRRVLDAIARRVDWK